MADHRDEGPGENGTPVPRDMPDQQARDDEDPWEAAPSPAQAQGEAHGGTDEGAGPATDVPDTDEAGTGRGDTPQSAAVNPEQPVPEEPAD